ncbi:hypothetical protein LTR94_037646, partial [Friedmanniomyces endolithicus]
VKPSSRATPRPESLFFSMAHMKPKATARKITKPMMPVKAMPKDMPATAPSTVGIIDSASSQYVLR